MDKQPILLYGQYFKKITWLLITLCTVSIATAQEKNTKKYTSTNPKAIELYEQAVRLSSQKDYKEAIGLLEKAHKLDKKFVEVYLQLATIKRELDEFDQTVAYLQQAQKCLPSGKMSHLYYEIAQLYYRSGLYAKAKTIADAIIAQDKPSTLLLIKIQTLQQNLSFALEQIKNPVVFKPRILPSPLNQFISQYFPILTVDQETILFTALANDYKENIYMSHQDSLGNWSLPISISDQINEPTSNEGTCTLSTDKKTLIFTACSKEGNYGICDLYITHQDGNTWSKPQNLGSHINAGVWQSQPSLSADGKTLYFVSERKENYGRHDIWQSTLQPNKEWSEATNLGPIINSKGREVSPFMHPNGQTLFFASDRVPSMGGFDIYYSNLLNGEWTTPVNLGYPINDHKDQVSIFVTADGKKGYYADGKRKDFNYQSSHLYEFDIPTNLVPMPKSDFVKLKIVDAQTGNPLAAQVNVYDMATDSCQQELTVDVGGETTLVINEGKEYLINITKDGHIFESRHVVYKTGDKAIMKPATEIALQPLAVQQAKILENVYFDYDAYTLSKKSTPELNRLVHFLQTNPGVCIELEGHTDSMGSDMYNQQLSTQRALTIYQYLTEAGIDASRLTYKGYGKTQPLANNDSPQNQQLNRRVAFRITALEKKP